MFRTKSSVIAEPLVDVAESLGAGNVVARALLKEGGAGTLVSAMAPDPHAGMWVGAGWLALEAEKDAFVAKDVARVNVEVAAILAAAAAERAAAFAVRMGGAPFLSPAPPSEIRDEGDDEEDDLTDDSTKGTWKRAVASPLDDGDDLQIWQPAKKQRSTLDKWVVKK
jgi:hypothetical protein